MNSTRRPLINTTDDPDMNPAALLRGAATYLQQYGWTTGEFYASSDNHNRFPAACSLGAINVCAHGRPILSSAETAEDYLTNAAIAAMRVFASHLDADYGTGLREISAIDIVSAWNDQDGMTRDEVIEELNQAAADWDDVHPDGGAR